METWKLWDILYVNKIDVASLDYCEMADLTGHEFHSILEKSHILCQQPYPVT